MAVLRWPAARHRLGRSFGRLIGGWPIWMHQIRLGRLVGGRYLVVTSIGRRSRATRRAAVMVLRQSPVTGELFVVAGDHRTAWFRNVCEAPAVEIWHGKRRFLPAQRLLTGEEIAELLLTIRREHPREARIQAAFFGWPWPATAGQIRSLAASLGGVAFRPAGSVDTSGRS